jgi:hypothetical protein
MAAKGDSLQFRFIPEVGKRIHDRLYYHLFKKNRAHFCPANKLQEERPGMIAIQTDKQPSASAVKKANAHWVKPMKARV